METKLERIADKSAHESRPIFTSLYHLLNEELLLQCHKELDGKKAVGIDEMTKEEYSRNLRENIRNLVERLKNKAYKPKPSLRVYIPKANGKKRPLGIAAYEDKIVQSGLKKILEAVYEPKFQENMYGFRPNRSCHMAVKDLCTSIIRKRINYVVDADIKGFFDHMSHEWTLKFVGYYIKDPNILNLVKKYLKAGVLEEGKYQTNESGSAQETSSARYWQISTCTMYWYYGTKSTLRNKEQEKVFWWYMRMTTWQDLKRSQKRSDTTKKCKSDWGNMVWK